MLTYGGLRVVMSEVAERAGSELGDEALDALTWEVATAVGIRTPEECVAGGHAATRRIIPFLEDDDSTYAVCDDDGHSPVLPENVSEIEELLQ